MKSIDVLTLIVVIGFLWIYYLFTRTSQHSDTLFVCFMICVFATLHKKIGPKL